MTDSCDKDMAIGYCPGTLEEKPISFFKMSQPEVANMMLDKSDSVSGNRGANVD